jgi:hypothetical protein
MALYRIIIGAMLFPVLNGEAGGLSWANRGSAANLQLQLEVSTDFFLFAALCLLVENKSLNK